jgi:hypothetical protein
VSAAVAAMVRKAKSREGVDRETKQLTPTHPSTPYHTNPPLSTTLQAQSPDSSESSPDTGSFASRRAFVQRGLCP